jgi:hypothetical protein
MGLQKRAISVIFILFSVTSFQKESMWLILLMLLILMVNKRSQIYTPPLYLLLFVPIIVGIFSGLNTDVYAAYKDAYYFLLPISFFFLGIQLSKIFVPNEFSRLVIIGGTLMSLIRIFVSFSYLGVEAFSQPYSARYAYGMLVETPVPILALGLLTYSKVFANKIFSNRKYLLHFVINGIGAYMCASRTYLIILLLFFIIYLLYKHTLTFFLGISLLFFLFILYAEQNKSMFTGSQIDNTFYGKLFNSFNEVQSADYTEEEIQLNYRGYESYMALNGFLQANSVEQLIGRFGKMVDLKTYVGLGSSDMRFIPVLHNGYLYILIKSGLLGLILYFIFYLRLIKLGVKKLMSKDGAGESKMISCFSLCIFFSLLITNYIVSGFFNSEMGVLMIFSGFSYFYMTCKNDKISFLKTNRNATSRTY